jgi:hypothetical protein
MCLSNGITQEKVEIDFAIPKEIIFDIDDGFLKQKLSDDSFQKLFYWQTAEDMIECENYNSSEFDNLLYNHPAEFVDMVYNNSLSQYFEIR